MIAGHIILEDIVLNFSVEYNTNSVSYTVSDIITGQTEAFIVPQDKFFAALSIAIHNTGEPDWTKDYGDAESIMGAIRWIP